MVVAAMALAFGVTYADGRLGADWIEEISWLYAFRPDGARAFLSTIAGSMIGVAGVTFSVTIASVVYASGQYGPRLLTNFMSDRGNQITLGTFIATFLYSLLILSTIRSEGETGGENPADGIAGAFVPHIGVFVALLLALACIAMLIYFIHHTPESIHVSNVIAGIGRGLRRKVSTLFPERIGEGVPGEEAREADEIVTEMPDGFYDEAVAVRADGSGYVQGIDTEAVLALATDGDLVIRIRHCPGDFVSEGDPLVLAWPRENVTDDLSTRLRVTFAWGTTRTPMQDVRFLVNELVEISARALSPGVNDPFTAISCLDWLSATLKWLAEREFPSPDRYDTHGKLRVVAEPTTFSEFVTGVYGQLRPYLAADRNAALHALKTIGEIAGRTDRQNRRDALRHEADAILDGARHALPIEADRATVEERHEVVLRLLAGYEDIESYTSRVRWIGGTA